VSIATVSYGKESTILACGNQAQDSLHQLLWQCAPTIGSWNGILLKANLPKDKGVMAERNTKGQKNYLTYFSHVLG
jgi:hypothetical protein